MKLVDTHTHLHFADFDSDREVVLQRARESGVIAFITLGTDVATSEQSIALAENHPDVFAAVGIHPSEAHLAKEEDFDIIRNRARSHDKVVAIGEIGLDFYWDSTHATAQYETFERMLEIARELQLPVVIHNRRAQREMQWFLQEKGISHLQGVMHCFEGDELDVQFYLEMGLHVSFAGNITYKNFRRRMVVKSVPLERLLLETDSPFLPPEPFRGKRNEPAYLGRICQKLAEIHQTTPEQIARITTQNAARLFSLPIPTE